MSLRLRLLLAAGAVACIALVVADVVTYSALRSFLYQRIDQTLTASLGPGGGGSGFGGDQQPVGDGGTPSGGGGEYVASRDANGTITVLHLATEPGSKSSYTPALAGHLPVASGTGGSSTTAFTTGPSVAGGPQFRVAVAARPDGSAFIVALPLDATMATLQRLLIIEMAVTGAALVVALALGWLLVQMGMRPLAAMEITAEAIADGELDRRVPGDDKRTEVGRLARALNVMLARIQRAFAERDATEAELRTSEERLRRFVADASHELRTPLAAVSAYAELFARGAGTRPADLERVMLGIRGESARMGRLVEDLLLLARLDERRPFEHAPVDLVELAGEVRQAAMLVGPGWPVALEAAEPVGVMGDRERLRQVLDNLLGNVRAHTPEGTPSTIRVHRDGRQAFIEVVDRGPGMTVDEAAHVFDRFYRADASRSRGTGGTGLGLSIVAAIVDSHGGSTMASPGADGGAVFSVRLPVPVSINGAESEGRDG